MAKYPNELSLTEHDPRDKLRSGELNLSGLKYSIEHLALLPLGLVVVGQDEYKVSRWVLGVRLFGTQTGGMEKAWEYVLTRKYRIGDLIEDPIDNAVFFPEERRDGRFKVVGLGVTDGRRLPGFPANFKLDGFFEGDKRQLRIVGTAVDFERNLLYLHDQQKNRIVCADLRFDRGQTSR